MAPTADEQKAAEETDAAEKLAAEQKAAEEQAAAPKSAEQKAAAKAAKKAKDEKAAEPLGTAEVKDAIADAQEQGFVGTKVDPLPNSAHSLESGPDAPPVHETPQRPDLADPGKETSA